MRAPASFVLLVLLFSCGPAKDGDSVRIFTAGIRHESNTFCPWPTTEENFTVRRAAEVLESEDWARYLVEHGVDVAPSVHAYASPYGKVDRSVYEKFKDEILEGARGAGAVDGVYLDLHGAMHVNGYEDAQVDLTRSLREVLGREVLFGASFDLHGNISQDLIDELDLMTAYRTAPHVDGAETRERAARLLLEAIRGGQRPAIAHINIPILIPGEKGITSVEPLRSLYAQLPEIGEKEGLADASIFAGMPWTDVRRAGMSVQVVAHDISYADQAREEAERLAGEIWEKRADLDFDVEALETDDGIRAALEAGESTVFLTDSGDNTTGGSAGDSTIVLRRLLAHKVPDAVLAGIVDPEAVEACEKTGVGNGIRVTVGGKIDHVFSEAFEIAGEVRFLTPPELRGTNRRACVVKVDGVLTVLLASRRSYTSPRDFVDVEIDPLRHKIVVAKLGYLFQPLRDIAPREILLLTPGFANQELESLAYENVRRPIYPLDPEMDWRP